MTLAIIFFIGLSVGYVASRYSFCIFGAILELFALGEARRIIGVICAMLVFGLVQMGNYQHGVEYPSFTFLVGGLLQGGGYFLAMGCPLGLLVRIGEGSKFHLVVFSGFVVGVAVYVSMLEKYIAPVLNSVWTGKTITLIDFFR